MAILLLSASSRARSTPEAITERNSRRGLDNDANGGERYFSVQAGHRRQLSQAQSLAPGPLHARVLLEVQPAQHPSLDLRYRAGQYGQSSAVAIQNSCCLLNSPLTTAKLLPALARLQPRIDPRADLRPRQWLRLQHPSQNPVELLLSCSLTAHRNIVSSLAILALMGGFAARASGARVMMGAIRVTFWGGMAMAITAGIGWLAGAIT